MLFPGETLFGDSPPEALAGSDGCKLGSKNSVWSLYARSQLLYASSLYVEWNKEMKENEKNEFAMRAWLETENIEATLNSHSCDIEKTSSEYYDFHSWFVRMTTRRFSVSRARVSL